MEEKRIEALNEMYEALTVWRNGEKNELDTLDKIHDITEEYNEWEELECRRIMIEERERNTITVKATIKYAGRRYPANDIEFE